jgi:hypothetical protein
MEEMQTQITSHYLQANESPYLHGNEDPILLLIYYAIAGFGGKCCSKVAAMLEERARELDQELWLLGRYVIGGAPAPQAQIVATAMAC